MAQQEFTSPLLAPDLQRKKFELERAAQMGRALMDQGSEIPQGQMVSGHYVAPSWTQYLSQGLKSYLGGRTMNSIPDRLADIQKSQQDYDRSLFMPQQDQGKMIGQVLASGAAGGSVGPTNQNAAQLGQALSGKPIMPLLFPNDPQRSLMAYQAMGPGNYLKATASQQAPTSLQSNLTAAGLQPGTPEFQRAVLENVNPGQRPTSLMQNLEAAGLQPGTPAYRDAVLQGTRGTTVNVGAGEKAWDTESAKLFAKRYDDLSTQAQSAQQMLGLLDLAQVGLDSGVRTGSLGSAEQAVRQMALTMGVGNADKIAGGELLTAVQNRMALLMRSPDSGMGLPGAVSDRDLNFLKESNIGLDRSPEGNRLMVDAFRKLEKRKLDIAKLADEYVQKNGRLDAGFNQIARQYADENPMFPQKEPDRAQQLNDILGF
ncbi:hypothetical protein [Castellaniella denitrificans]|uniref:Uncharacterized protein n=1 Tax=Castellaniella denitrificans TaxID=56119 RepID=A0ABT4M8I4_9BURK|nr:hypothetical protein [Castellaniella denitrificans]MCZ4330780.1 hypothetical protein [Castellaniella denitrificans]